MPGARRSWCAPGCHRGEYRSDCGRPAAGATESRSAAGVGSFSHLARRVRAQHADPPRGRGSREVHLLGKHAHRAVEGQSDRATHGNGRCRQWRQPTRPARRSGIPEPRPHRTPDAHAQRAMGRFRDDGELRRSRRRPDPQPNPRSGRPAWRRKPVPDGATDASFVGWSPRASKLVERHADRADSTGARRWNPRGNIPQPQILRRAGSTLR